MRFTATSETPISFETLATGFDHTRFRRTSGLGQLPFLGRLGDPLEFLQEDEQYSVVS